MSFHYPAGPAKVPDNLARPSRTYQMQAWVALGGLLLFVGLYLFLTAWFVRTAYRLLEGGLRGGGDMLGGIVVGLCAAFLSVFLIKALFFVKHGGQSDDLEVTAKDEPALFAFLHRLADETGAPRPHRVFLSARVNAAVFYDLSILNLLYPSRKNLEIGLGLVNVLTLDELKAVLAHEFGHFAQRTMAVGRWVYIAQQIASAVVYKRDALDRFLTGLSHFDLRIAWMGWLLSAIVWSIRSVLETVFTGVVLAQRALSREMEMQADLVAVSVTGSDALIHALHRTQAGDEAWDRAASFVGRELGNQRGTEDFFALQSAVVTHLRRVLGKADYGEVPPLPMRRPEAHRVFKADLVQPAGMWATHPANYEREANAKRTYVPAPLGTASAWTLFADAATLRKRVTARMLAKSEAPTVPLAESLAALEAEFQREYLDPAYRGAYLGRSVVRHVDKPEALFGNPLTDAPLAPDALYPAQLEADVEQLRTLEREKAFLEAFTRHGQPVPGDGLLYRGRRIFKRDLSGVSESLKKERETVLARVRWHDQACRATHLAWARTAGNGWAPYLQGVAALLHYADHTEARLRYEQAKMAGVYRAVTATRSVDAEGVSWLNTAANNLYRPLRQVYEQCNDVSLGDNLSQQMAIAHWRDALEEFKLPPPTRENLGDWLNAIDGWVDAATGALSALKLAALDELLVTEGRLRAAQHGETLPAAPTPPTAPARFTPLLSGAESFDPPKLSAWKRFVTADGVLASIARLAVAGGIVAAVLGFGGAVGEARLTIYNGLARSVHVDIGEQAVSVPAFSSRTVDIPADTTRHVLAKTYDGKVVESTDMPAVPPYTHEVYNVAAAAPLVEWVAAYGNAAQRPRRPLGAVRWHATTAEDVFKEPPRQISTKGGGGTREVLSGLGDAMPRQMLELVQKEADQARIIDAHARWDTSDSPFITDWLQLASGHAGFAQLIAERLRESPNDVVTLRAEQNAASGDGHAEVCRRHRERAQSQPDNPDFQYLAIRCIADPAAQHRAFEEGARRWPSNGWLAYAAGYSLAEEARWDDALARFDTAWRTVPAIKQDLAIDIARIRRMQSGDSAQLSDLEAASEMLSFVLASESGQADSGSPVLAALRRGNLEEALRKAEPSERATVLRMVAASDGARPEWVAEALALPTNQGITSASLWAAIGLAAREHRDIGPYLSLLRARSGEDHTGQIARFERFLVELRKKNYAAAERLLDGLTPILRGHACGVGLIVAGDAAPAAWRSAAKRLLFLTERPYFT